MGKRGRPERAQTAREDGRFDPETYPGLLEAMEEFRKQLDVVLRSKGLSQPRTLVAESVPGFTTTALSAWTTNAKRGDPLARIRLMIASLESQTPSRGADRDLDEAWAHHTVRPKARMLSNHLGVQLKGIVEGGSANQPKTRPVSVVPMSSEATVYSKSMLRSIAEGIQVCSDNDPANPEYPPDMPRFPATPTMLIEIDGRQVYLKDESKNTTGTHKDRWAWEMIVRYRDWITSEALLQQDKSIVVPRYSMISSGSAAVALQTALRSRLLPNLHVLVDNTTHQLITDQLRILGARVFKTDLSRELLSPAKVCQHTQNILGQDVTPRHAEDPFNERFYDWLCFEILNEKPRHIFVPFGTGGLFANIIFLVDKALSGYTDPRLLVDPDQLRGINVYGATTENPQSRMTMLYAPYRPTLPGIETAIRKFVGSKSLGSATGVFQVADEQASSAMSLVRSLGSRADESGAAALALYATMSDALPVDERVLVVNTGSIYLGGSLGD